VTGCGTPAHDLFIVERRGTVPGAQLRLRVTDDGFARCNRVRHEISSRALILSRVLADDLADLAEHGLTLPAQRGSVMRYDIRVEEGVVRFSDNSGAQPPVFYRAAQLVRRIAKEDCKLPR
jgi:hypothetical protein